MLKVWTNSFQEVLEAVLFGAWSIPPTAHGWLLSGSPTKSYHAWIAYWSTCRLVVATTDHDTRRGISHVRLGRI